MELQLYMTVSAIWQLPPACLLLKCVTIPVVPLILIKAEEYTLGCTIELGQKKKSCFEAFRVSKVIG